MTALDRAKCCPYARSRLPIRPLQKYIMLKIWGRASSVNVKKVLWCAEEASVPYVRVDAGGSYGGIETAEFAVLNPNRRIPVIDDGGTALWESNVIVRYLAARYAPQSIYRVDAAERALAERWMDWSSMTFAQPFVTIFHNMIRAAPGERDINAVNTAIELAGRLLGIVDEALREKDYLSGNNFGIGDIPLGCFIHGWFSLPIVRPGWLNLSRWYARLMERPAYRKIVALPLS